MEWAPFTADPREFTIEELAAFRRWSVFLPSEARLDSERSAAYVRSRQAGNPRFFEHLRERLAAAVGDCATQKAGGVDPGGGEDLAEALHLVLRGQWTAHGFHVCREFHKALGLARPCVELADHLCSGRPELLFWPVLCRATLGSACVEFRKFDDARDVLYKAVDLLEGAGELAAREQVLLGTCFAHLGRLERTAGAPEEALRCAELQTELLGRHLPALLDGDADREVHANAMATSFSFYGLCECSFERYDKAVECFRKAEEFVEKHKGTNKDALAISTSAAERRQQAEDAARLRAIREEHAATGGPIPF
mmetsp:Transcript_129865/g.403937  ORF Transcript_129865/g.403937 Transcript_129865/m.403937 type:complete len:310 (-) Transcript_129865:83-1012(-)